MGWEWRAKREGGAGDVGSSRSMNANRERAESDQEASPFPLSRAFAISLIGSNVKLTSRLPPRHIPKPEPAFRCLIAVGARDPDRLSQNKRLGNL